MRGFNIRGRGLKERFPDPQFGTGVEEPPPSRSNVDPPSRPNVEVDRVAVQELKLRYQNGYIYIYITVNMVSQYSNLNSLTATQ